MSQLTFLLYFQCDPGVGTDALYDLIYRHRVAMVISSACSEVTETLAEIVPYWNLILVSINGSFRRMAWLNLVL